MTPFSILLNQRATEFVGTLEATSTPIPAGLRFIVEHISGFFGIRTVTIIDAIFAFGSGQEVYLPTHQIVSRELNAGDPFGLIREYQFGSPVRMYINAGDRITIRGDSQGAFEIHAAAVGRLVSM